MTSQDQPQVNVKWNSQQMIAVPQDSLNLSVVMATGGLLTTSVISGDAVTRDRSLEDVTELLTVSDCLSLTQVSYVTVYMFMLQQSQQQPHTDILHSNPPSVWYAINKCFVFFVDWLARTVSLVVEETYGLWSYEACIILSDTANKESCTSTFISCTSLSIVQ